MDRKINSHLNSEPFYPFKGLLCLLLGHFEGGSVNVNFRTHTRLWACEWSSKSSTKLEFRSNIKHSPNKILGLAIVTYTRMKNNNVLPISYNITNLLVKTSKNNMFWWHLRQDNMRTHYPRQLVLDFMTPGVIVVFLPGKLWCNCLVNCPWQSHHAFMKKSSYLVACDSKHFPSWFFTIFHLQVAMSKYIPAHINLGPPPMALSLWALRHCTRPLLKWSNHMSLLILQ